MVGTNLYQTSAEDVFPQVLVTVGVDNAEASVPAVFEHVAPSVSVVAPEQASFAGGF